MGHFRKHSFTATTDHDFSGMVSGQLIRFDGTNIVSAGITGTSGDLWSASTGTNSIIANNGSGNIASGVASVVLGGLGNVINTGGTNSSIVGGTLNTINHPQTYILGSNITSISANTTYINGLNIGTINSDTPVTSLAVSSNGMVVSGNNINAISATGTTINFRNNI